MRRIHRMRRVEDARGREPKGRSPTRTGRIEGQSYRKPVEDRNVMKTANDWETKREGKE